VTPFQEDCIFLSGGFTSVTDNPLPRSKTKKQTNNVSLLSASIHTIRDESLLILQRYGFLRNKGSVGSVKEQSLDMLQPRLAQSYNKTIGVKNKAKSAELPAKGLYTFRTSPFYFGQLITSLGHLAEGLAKVLVF
jgi:hypothetical protein